MSSNDRADLIVRIMANIEPLRASLANATTLLQTTSAQAAKLATALGGEKLIASAARITAGIQAIGGATTQTAAEAQRFEGILTNAIEKMQAMGQAVPADIAHMRDSLKAVADQSDHASVNFSNLTGSVKTMALGFATGLLSLQAFETVGRDVIGFVQDSIKEYLEAERTQRQLTAALVAQGTATPAVLDKLEALSKKYEQLTVNSQEAVKSAESLLIQVGNVLPSQMDKALQATTDLAAGLGIDLTSAAMLVSKSFEDNFTALKKAGVQIDDTRAKAEGMGYVLGEIEKRFGGQALSEAESYAGQIEQLGNAFKDFQKDIGRGLIELGDWQLGLTALRVVLAAVSTQFLELFAFLNTAPTMRDLANPFTAGPNWVARAKAQMDEMAAAMKRIREAANTDTSRDEQNARQEPTAADRAAAAEAKRLLEEYQKAVKNLADTFSGTALAKEVQKYAAAVADANKHGGVTLEQMPKLIDTLHGLELQGAKLPPILKDIADQFYQFAPDDVVKRAQAFVKTLNDFTFIKPVPHDIFTGLVNNAGVPSAGAVPVNLGPAPVFDPTRLVQYTKGLREVASVMAQVTAVTRGGWQVAMSGITGAVQILGSYTEGLAKIPPLLDAETRAQEVAGLAQGALHAAETLGISLAIQGIATMIMKHKEYQKSIKDTTATLQSMGYSQQEVHQQLVQQGTDFSSLKHVSADMQKFLDDAKARVDQVTSAINGLTQITMQFGGTASAAMRPMIASLLESNRLTQDQRALLEGMSQQPTWEYLQQTAEKYGIALDSLGAAFQQNKLGAQFDELFTAFTQLTDSGADPVGVLSGMADEVQALLDNAMKFGSAIPSFMKPMLEQMTQLGLLTDDAGNKLTDLSRFNFTDSIESSFQKMATILEQIRDLLATGLPNAAQAAARGIDQAFAGPAMGRGGSNGAAGILSGGAPAVAVQGGAQTTTVILEIDGRKFTEAVTVPNLPGAVRRTLGPRGFN